MQAEYFALEGVSELLDTIERIRAELNPSLVVEGVVLTMFDERTNLAQQVAEELEEIFWGEALHYYHSEKHTAGGGPKSRPAGIDV